MVGWAGTFTGFEVVGEPVVTLATGDKEGEGVGDDTGNSTGSSMEVGEGVSTTMTVLGIETGMEMVVGALVAQSMRLEGALVSDTSTGAFVDEGASVGELTTMSTGAAEGRGVGGEATTSTGAAEGRGVGGEATTTTTAVGEAVGGPASSTTSSTTSSSTITGSSTTVVGTTALGDGVSNRPLRVGSGTEPSKFVGEGVAHCVFLVGASVRV